MEPDDLQQARAEVEQLQDALMDEQDRNTRLTRRLQAADAAVVELDARLTACVCLREHLSAEVDHQRVTLDQRRARIVELEAQLPHEHEE